MHLLMKLRLRGLYLLIAACSLHFSPLHAQKIATPSDSLRLSTSTWSLGLIAGGKTIKSLFVYDYGIFLTKSVSLGHRIRLEANYRTSGPMFEQAWGRYYMNMQTQIGSPMGGLSYEWFPFVNTSGKTPKFWKFKPNFFRSLKLKAGAWFIQDPIYHFEASLVDPVKWGSITFTPQEIGAVTTTIETQKFQPYIGLGYDRFYVGKKSNISLEGGLLYQGKPQVGMTATNMLELTATQAPKLQDNLGDYQLIPFLQVVFQISL
jgi:hypothetical protein